MAASRGPTPEGDRLSRQLHHSGRSHQERPRPWHFEISDTEARRLGRPLMPRRVQAFHVPAFPARRLRDDTALVSIDSLCSAQEIMRCSTLADALSSVPSRAWKSRPVHLWRGQNTPFQHGFTAPGTAEPTLLVGTMAARIAPRETTKTRRRESAGFGWWQGEHVRPELVR